MIKRLSISLGAIAVLALSVIAWTPAASANGGGEGDLPQWDGWLLPGVLEADGDGIAAAAGKLNIRLCAEEGILLTKGESAVPADSYDEVVEWLGLHVYFGFHGCAELEGRWVAALVVGHGLTLRAEGIGLAFLKGEGAWAKDNGDSGEWGADGQVIKIGTKATLWEKTPTPLPEGDPTEEPHEDPKPTPTPGDVCAFSEGC